MTLLQTLKRSIALTLLVGLIVPALSMGVAPQRAEAQAPVGLAACASGFLGGILGVGAVVGGVVAAGVGALGGLLAVPTNETNLSLLTNTGVTASAASVSAGANSSLTIKECIIDPLLWILKEMIITMITQEILSWVGSGFHGAPVFLQDPVDFFKRVGDRALNVFLNQSGVEQFLCTPFRLDVQISVFLDYAVPSYSVGGASSCVHDGIFAGTGGSFNILVEQGNLNNGGGLPALMGMLDDRNNPIGSYFMYQSEAAARVNTVKASEGQLLSYGNGYFSMSCSGAGGTTRVCTPGEYIVGQVDDWSGGMLGQLEVADEVGEIINAILAALVREILTDVNEGLAGAGIGGSTVNWAGAVGGINTQSFNAARSSLPAAFQPATTTTP